MKFGPWFIGLIVLSIPIFMFQDDKTRYGYVGIILLSLALFHVNQISSAASAVQNTVKSVSK